MIDKKRDYLLRKIVKYIFFIAMVIGILAGSTMLFIDKNSSLVIFKKTILMIFIIASTVLVAIFILCVVEIVINNIINKKVKKFISERKYQDGINYIEGMPKIKIMYDMYERRFYYCGLLNLYLDDQVKARKEFLLINFYSHLIDSSVFVNAMLYLLLINNESPENQEKEFVRKCFNDNIVALKRSKYQAQKNGNNITAIEKILNNDFSNLKPMLYDKKDIPLIGRLL